MLTQPNPSTPTLAPTSGGGSANPLITSTLFGEFERRRQTPSDVQDHLLTLYTWARGWPFAHVVELGVRAGVSTSAFLAALEVDRKGHLWSFDTADADVPGVFRESGYWTFTQADALGEKALDVAPREIEVLFIDLDPHSFEQTLTALTLWVPRLVPGGVALLHDTEWPEVNYVRPGSAESEVGRALDVYCGMKDLEWQNLSGCNGLGVLRIR